MHPGGAVVAEESNQSIMEKIRRISQREYDLYVLGGYISKGVMPAGIFNNPEERIMYRTTLGRGGSDLTAVIFGAALHIPVFLYSDTDGVKDSNPNLVGDAVSIPRLSREEALEFSRYGSKILYDAAMEHALRNKVDVRSMNTFNPMHPGTIISGEPVNPGKPKGISFLEDGKNYVVAVVLHEVGKNQQEIDRLQNIFFNFPVISSNYNIHSITFTLPGEVVTASARQIYNSVMRA